MHRAIRKLEQLQVHLTNDAAAQGTTVEQRRAAEAAKQQRLAELTPYKQTEYHCLERVAELRQALRDIEELQAALGHGSSGGVSHSREEEEEGEERAGDAVNADDDEHAKLLPRHEHHQRPLPSTNTVLLEQELARSRQEARRAYHNLQRLQREAARFASMGAGVASVPETSAPSASPEAVEWQRALLHVERAKRWYCDVFGIHVVPSVGDPMLQLTRPAQTQLSAGGMRHFSSGANAVSPCVTAAASAVFSSAPRRPRNGRGGSGLASPQEGDEARGDGSDGSGRDPSTVPPMRMLCNAHEDAEFQEFFATVEENNALMDAAIDRLSDGVGRLLENARGVQDELAVQDALLQQTELGVAAREMQLTQMNRRLRRAILEMDDSSTCMYVTCLFILLLVLGLLLRVAS
ncbi:hypothetical protein JKF63_07150 [Porcisia hertigi]|uniref:Uncharacterized protein n=1 Tax=Porcisia hertigi TaxID=2761500 RepID=A0A836LKM8_9TRYP|nr:hypothetical protein JKF63_07150 [Porcisia hertigi]